MSKPVDPRLWRYSRSARWYLAVSVGLSLIMTGSIVTTALMVARVLAGVITDPARRTIGVWDAELVVLAVAVACRVAATWWQTRVGGRAGARVVAELSDAVLSAGARLPQRELDSRRGELAVVATTGLSGLRGYLTGYLPALILAVLVPPCVVLVIGWQDPVSAIIIVATVPLVPVFMILIGLLSKGRADAALQAMTRLADQMLDLFAGLPTLQALGRQHGPERRIAELGAAHRRTTMATLKVAFLSSMVLELLATLCVALVAVSIGMRLVYGHMPLEAGIAALILAPEGYLPLRVLGERFHAAEDGMAAASRAFAVIESSVGGGWGGTPHPSLPAPCAGGRSNPRLVVRGVTVVGRDGAAPSELSAEFLPGQVTVLTGNNGAGKSTALQVILGLATPDRGAVEIDGVDLATVDVSWWWTKVAWLAQRPVLVPGTLRENVEMLGAQVGSAELEEACVATGFDLVLEGLSEGWETRIGVGGTGLSLGERQRLALSRVLASGKPVLLLDEPTAHLDPDSEAAVLASVVRRAAAGDTVVLVGHRPAVLAAADVIVEVTSDARVVA